LNKLHNQYSLSGRQIQLRNVYIFEVVFFEETLASPNVGSFRPEIQFDLDIFLKSLDQPLITEIME